MQTLSTQPTKASTIKRQWYLIDVKDKVLGRIATVIAQLLMGKAKPYFVRHLDCGDYVVVTNAKHVKVTGKKEEAKRYFNYSGFPGGLRVRTLAKVRSQKPEEIVGHAVKGMLPQNKLRDRMLSRLFIFPEQTHSYDDKFKIQNAKLKI